MKKWFLILSFVTLVFTLAQSVFADSVIAVPADGIAVKDGKYVLKAPGLYPPQRWQIVSDGAKEEQKLYRLQFRSRPNITVTRTRAVIDNEGTVDGVTEQRVRRGLFPIFRRARFVPVE
jgi:hypothetical protein